MFHLIVRFLKIFLNHFLLDTNHNHFVSVKVVLQNDFCSKLLEGQIIRPLICYRFVSSVAEWRLSSCLWETWPESRLHRHTSG